MSILCHRHPTSYMEQENCILLYTVLPPVTWSSYWPFLLQKLPHKIFSGMQTANSYSVDSKLRCLDFVCTTCQPMFQLTSFYVLLQLINESEILLIQRMLCNRWLQGMQSILVVRIWCILIYPWICCSIYRSVSITCRRNFSNASVLHIFFRGITCMKYARNAYMTWDVVFGKYGKHVCVFFLYMW
jgi:hypothetical protein